MFGSSRNISPSQHGAALIVSLVMLVAITLIGVFVMSSSRLEWLMTGNSRFQSDARMKAEATISAGERALTAKMTSPRPPSWDMDRGYYKAATLAELGNPGEAKDWRNFASITSPVDPSAQYIVEYVGDSCVSASLTLQNCSSPPRSSPTTIEFFTYRIWSLSTDSKGASRVAQSYYRGIINHTGYSTIGGIGFPVGNFDYRHIAQAEPQ